MSSASNSNLFGDISAGGSYSVENGMAGAIHSANFHSAAIRARVDDVIKSPEDKRSYRGLVLNNGLKALLVSDPSTDLAAAALTVRIGAPLMDP